MRPRGRKRDGARRWLILSAPSASPRDKAFHAETRRTRRRTIPLMADTTKPFSMQPIGFVRNAFTETSQIPKGLGATHTATGTLEIRSDLEQGLTDIEGFSHLIVIWVFDRSEGFELLGTPPSDNRPHGVFSTRSPYRPNPIGLTIVELVRRDRAILHVRGLDMLDGTPILDIKPYLSSVPAESLRRGWLDEVEARKNQSN
jgi:tRNA (adenine37-N6)-methyltransferase